MALMMVSEPLYVKGELSSLAAWPVPQFPFPATGAAAPGDWKKDRARLTIRHEAPKI